MGSRWGCGGVAVGLRWGRCDVAVGLPCGLLWAGVGCCGLGAAVAVDRVRTFRKFLEFDPVYPEKLSG